jgi:hypothetical protein|tara:strand:+ start:145 stop:678 length:534 start_codon:yes stop_codon:yes gene_type:complete
MANIDDFKANLIGGGARANQFRVTLTAPPGIATGLDVRRTSFLVKGANLPGQTLGEIAIPFRGRSIYIAGDREFADPWEVTVMNDTDFMVRNAIELWMNGINDLADNTGVVAPADYQTDLTVEQLDRDDTILKSYIFRSAWPTTLGEIELTSDNADAIEEFTVSWRYQHFEASGVSF